MSENNLGDDNESVLYPQLHSLQQISENNSSDGSEANEVVYPNLYSSQQCYELNNIDNNNYSENDDINTESDTKSAHSSYSNATYSDDVVINRIENVIVNEKHLIDHNIDDNSIRKPSRPFRKTCCKSMAGSNKLFFFFNSSSFFFHFVYSQSQLKKKKNEKKALNQAIPELFIGFTIFFFFFHSLSSLL